MIGQNESRLDAIKQERGKKYGPVSINHRSIGMGWGGILLQSFMAGRWKPGDPLPPEIVTLMMTFVKASREAYQHTEDNVDDAVNYWRFTEELSEAREFGYEWQGENPGTKTVVEK